MQDTANSAPHTDMPWDGQIPGAVVELSERQETEYLADGSLATDAENRNILLIIATSGEADADTAIWLSSLSEQLDRSAVALRVLTLDNMTDPDAEIQDALHDEPDLVVVIGPLLVDSIDRLSAGNLEQRFLMIGAQLPEPTSNVVAVVWPGAEDRTPYEYDDASDTLVASRTPGLAQHGDTAVRVGILATESAGDAIVIMLPEYP